MDPEDGARLAISDGGEQQRISGWEMLVGTFSTDIAARRTLPHRLGDLASGLDLKFLNG